MQDSYTEGELNQAYKETFGTESGKVVLRHLLRVHGLLNQAHVDLDSHSTAFNDGGRNVVIQILKVIHKKKTDLEDKIIEEGVDYVL